MAGTIHRDNERHPSHPAYNAVSKAREAQEKLAADFNAKLAAEEVEAKKTKVPERK
jgi:hypothetical protein